MRTFIAETWNGLLGLGDQTGPHEVASGDREWVLSRQLLFLGFSNVVCGGILPIALTPRQPDFADCFFFCTRFRHNVLPGLKILFSEFFFISDASRRKS